MWSHGFDAIKVDEINDVMATIRGIGGGREILLNGHLDHVPPGGMMEPYSGRVMDGHHLGVEGEWSMEGGPLT